MKRTPHPPRGRRIQTPWAQLVAVIGESAGEQLSASFGGRPLYIPAAPGPHHPLSVAVGLEAARALGQAYPGARFDIPIGQGKRAQIVELDGKGWTRERIARHVRCTVRHVYQVLADDKTKPPPEPDLFT